MKAGNHHSSRILQHSTRSTHWIHEKLCATILQDPFIAKIQTKAEACPDHSVPATNTRQPTCIPRWKDDAHHDAILAVIPKDEERLPFKTLAQQAGERLSTKVRQRLGSVGWHTATVKLEMEVRGEIELMPGASPRRLSQYP